MVVKPEYKKFAKIMVVKPEYKKYLNNDSSYLI